MRKPFRVTSAMRSRDKEKSALACARDGNPVLLLFGITNKKCDCGNPECESPGKHPIGSEFPRGFLDATTDLKKLRAGFKRHPNANYGFVPIEKSLVVDIDSPDARAEIDKLNLPPTATVKTARGEHRYYECEDLKDWRPKKLDNVDFRFLRNGYVVGAGSRHVTGKLYKWRDEQPHAATVSSDDFKAHSKVRLDFGKLGKPISEGGRNNHLTSIAGFMRAKGLNASAIDVALQALNEEVCRPPLSRGEVNRIAFSVGRYETKQEEFFGTMSDVVAEEIRWLYGPYFPRGALTIIDGPPGVGKSNFTMAMIAAVTRGRAVPWSKDRPKGKGLVMSAEDDPSRVLKPRLDANGADTHQIRYARELFSLDAEGLALLRAEIEQFGPDIVVIDPIIAFLAGGADLYSPTDMTRFLTEIDKIAREFDCAIIIVRHLRKAREGSAINQGLGSIAVAGRVRSMLVLGRHPDDRDLRAVAHMKSNYGEEGPTIVFSYKIDEGDKVPFVRWLGTDKNISAEDIMRPDNEKGPGRPPGPGVDAELFLQNFLSAGERSSTSVKRAAEAHGFTDITIRRAREALSVVIRKRGRESFWKLQTARK